MHGLMLILLEPLVISFHRQCKTFIDYYEILKGLPMFSIIDPKARYIVHHFKRAAGWHIAAFTDSL